MSGRNFHRPDRTISGNFLPDGRRHEEEAQSLPGERISPLTPYQRERVGHIPALQRRSERRALRLRCFAVAFGFWPEHDVLLGAEAVLAWVEHAGTATPQERLQFLDAAAQRQCASVHELLAIASDIETFVMEGDDA
ncbi:hypothetical protein [uncultured Sphingomonas sp.]|uniref:hypothetical protein n=1 Tax=uncultured Sphingomonas sp. TaxID=158754 RepID=UPI0025E6DC2F|nr:hypothetical protein [uncultured Sphingomonas sp.]